MARVKGLSKPANRRKAIRPPRLSSIPAVPRGPKLYSVPKSLQKGTNGPNEPPPGFVTATTSRVEWWVYFALFKVLAPNRDPRDGRNGFIGIPGIFGYQTAFEGGRNRTGGGQIIDFTIEPHELTTGQPVALRLQTERFHVFTDDIKQGREQLLRSRLSRSYVVRDLYEQNFLFDPSGQAVVIAVKNALRGMTEPNPVRGGNPLRIPANMR
jgi:hypothetical protein